MTAVAVACGTGSAAAGDRAGIWTGVYVGANVGYGWVSGTGLDGWGLDDPSGFIGGVHAGYNHQFGHFVLGIEADYSWADISTSGTVLGVASVKASVDNLWTVRGRAGVVVGDNLLLYATAGYGEGTVKATATAGNVSFSSSGKGDGWIAGGGIEYAFTPSILGRVEGLFGEDLGVVRAGLSYKFGH